MTTVGHSLAGASIGVLCMPRFRSRVWRAVLIGAFIVLANTPDVPAPGWGHSRYDISHSVFVNLAWIVAAAGGFFLVRSARHAIGGWRIVAGAGAAALSHLLLDSFYNHGYGVAIYWPVSQARLNLAMPWFSVLHGGWKLDAHTLQVVWVETLFYGTVLAVCVLLRDFGTRLRRSDP